MICLSLELIESNQYLARRKSKSKETQKVQTIEDDLANMKGELNEIKSLLKELINGS
jgi:hypothetical protein